MEFKIENDPSFAVAVAKISPGETVLAEADAMVSMSGDVEIETKKMTGKSDEGGLLETVKGAAKRVLAGESFLINHLTAKNSEAEVCLAPALPGDIESYELGGSGELIVQSGSYLAGDEQVSLDGEWGGSKSFFGGEGLFMLRAAGTGTVLVNSFGGISAETVDGEYIVDTGHIVAFEDSLDFEVTTFNSGWISSFLSGEGLVCKFKGRGTVFTQSRAPRAFGEILGQVLPERES
ncbi:MAG: TIGR00266 family protein [bacterium]